MQKRLLFLVSLLLCLATTMMAQITTSGLSGNVKANGEDVIGATVEAIHVPTGTKYQAVTNTKGAFAINGMRPGGPYTVKVSYIGYEGHHPPARSDLQPPRVALRERTGAR